MVVPNQPKYCQQLMNEVFRGQSVCVFGWVGVCMCMYALMHACTCVSVCVCVHVCDGRRR